MNWDIIATFIQTVGFPAVCVLGMGYYVKYITDQHHAETEKLNDQHRAEIAEVTTALNNNTLALQKLTDFIQIEKDRES